MSDLNNQDVTPNNVSPAAFLCYLNGRRVPIVGATVRSAAGDVPTATIEFYPSKHMLRFGADDRVEVVLFYLDTGYYNPPQYCLLFDGEIASWNYSTTAENRNITASAVADLSIFRQINYGFLNTISKIGNAAASPSADTDTAAANAVYFGPSLMADGLLVNGASVRNGTTISPTIKRPYDILHNVLMALTGSTNQNNAPIPLKNRPTAMMNFFTRWARKRNFLNRFVAVPDFDDLTLPDGTPKGEGIFPLLQAYYNNQILLTLQQTGTEETGDGTIADVINRIFDNVSYEMAAIATPPAVRANLKYGYIEMEAGGVTVVDGTDRVKDPNLSPVRLASYYAKPKMFFAVPPMFNVVFPSMVRSISYAETYMGQPTRLYMGEEALNHWLGLVDGNSLHSIANMVLSTAYPPEAHHVMQKALGVLKPDGAGHRVQSTTYEGARMDAKNTLIYPSEFYLGPLIAKGMIPSLFSTYARTLTRDTSGAPSAAAVDAANQNNIKNLLQLYVQNEFYIRKYNKRVGSVDMVFNPYVLPGYPTVVFDREDGLHHVGYVSEVQHQLSSRGMSTQMGYTGGRTLAEWLNDIKQDTLRTRMGLASAPADPIDEVRLVTQYIGSLDISEGTANARAAKAHYDRMFYPGIDTHKWVFASYLKRNDKWSWQEDAASGPRPEPYQHSSVFDAAKMLKIDDRDFEFGTGGDVVSRIAGSRGSERTARPPRPRDRIAALTFTDTSTITPKEEYAELFQSTTAAMRGVSRPVCNIMEYIRFRNGLNTEAYGGVDNNRYSEVIKFLAQSGKHPINERSKTVWTTRTIDGIVIPDRIYELDSSEVNPADIPKITEAYVDWDKGYDNLLGPVVEENDPRQPIQVIPSNKSQVKHRWDEVIDAYLKEVAAAHPEEA